MTNIHRLEVTASVMDDAMALIASAPADPWVAVVAKRQLAGRGQRGRSWVDVPGLKLAIGLPRALYPVSTARVGLVLANKINCQIKWVNDLYKEGLKIGGILTEARTQGEHSLTVVGIGINSQAHEGFGGFSEVDTWPLEDLVDSVVQACRGGEILDPPELTMLAERDYLKGKLCQAGSVIGIGQGWLASGTYLINQTPVNSGSIQVIG